VNGTGGASLSLFNVEIEFVSAMNSFIYILGGKVILENVKVDNQSDVMWNYPLVDVYQSISAVSVEIYSCTITNSMYKHLSSLYKSAIVFFSNSSLLTRSINLNISLFSFYNNSFDLNGSSNFWGGGVSYFICDNSSSCMSFF
jgi:hypothetical protein